MATKVRHATAQVHLQPTGYCHSCRKPVEHPRTFCAAPECVEGWKIKSDGQYARDQVFQRDRGKCQACGLDTEKLRALLYKVRNEKGADAYLALLQQFEKQTGYSFSLEKHAWEADHVVAVADGGGSCDLHNLTTLCVPCHKAKTKRWFKNKARRRYKMKQKNRR